VGVIGTSDVIFILGMGALAAWADRAASAAEFARAPQPAR
jgi:hypothetical protein